MTKIIKSHIIWNFSATNLKTGKNNGKEEEKLSIFGHDMILNLENTKFSKSLLELRK